MRGPISSDRNYRQDGVADFRSPGGVWEKYDPEDFYFQKFLASEQAREKYWQMSTELYESLRKAKANLVHLAIAELEKITRVKINGGGQ